MPLVIPVLDANDSLSEIALDGETYFLHLSWNAAGDFWTLGIESASHDVLVSGIAIVPRYALTDRLRISGMPAGDFVALPPNARQDTISRTDLPSGVVPLFYFSAAELAAAAAGSS